MARIGRRQAVKCITTTSTDVSIAIMIIVGLLVASPIPTLAQEPDVEAWTPGPQAWIEYPFEGQILDLPMITLEIVATDSEGIAQVDLVINGQALAGVQAIPLLPGTNHSVSARHDWRPPTEGEYIVEARARNTSGVYGEASYVKFCVGSCKASAMPTSSPIPAPLIVPTDTPYPAVDLHTPTPRPAQVLATDTPKPAMSMPDSTPLGYDLYVRRMDFMQTNPVVGDQVDLSIMLATDIAPQGAPYFPASFLRWRQGSSFPWNEESCPDNSQYASCMKNVSFSYNQPGSYVVEVQADNRNTVSETDESNNTKTWTINVGEVLSPEPPAPPQAEIYFWADPTSISSGQCAMLYWEVSSVQAVYLDGEGVEGSFNREVCPAATTAYTLRVVKQDGSTEDRQVVVTVQSTIGSPEFPPAGPSTQDAAGPVVSNMGIRWEGCSFYGYATITDDSGVGWAQFHFNDYDTSTQWRSLWMSDRGNGYWETEYPVQVSATSGVVDYAVYADDTIGNHTESEMLGDTYDCGGSEIPQTLNW